MGGLVGYLGNSLATEAGEMNLVAVGGWTGSGTRFVGYLSMTSLNGDQQPKLCYWTFLA